MSVRIKNSTPVNGESMCESCVDAYIEKGYRESEQTVMPRNVSGPPRAFPRSRMQ